MELCRAVYVQVLPLEYWLSSPFTLSLSHSLGVICYTGVQHYGENKALRSIMNYDDGSNYYYYCYYYC